MTEPPESGFAPCTGDATRCEAAKAHGDFQYQQGERAATERIVAWLRDVSRYVDGNMEDDERASKAIDEHWCVDPVDTADLADAIERGEHVQ